MSVSAVPLQRRNGHNRHNFTLTALAVAGIAFALSGAKARAGNLTVAQIVAENAKARGGLEAWRKVQTMVWLGHIESDHAPMPSMAFVMEQKRPNMTHFVIHAMHETTQRVFDGTSGWKIGPNLGGGSNAQPYTMQELRFAQAAPGLDGLLIDYTAKGYVVTLQGLDDIEGHKAYRLGVRLASGENDSLWVDAQTLLETRYTRPSDGVVGVARAVTLVYRDYKTFNGLLVPSVIETVSGVGQASDRMVIERVVVNAPLDDSRFARPGSASHSRKSSAPVAPAIPGNMGQVNPDSGSAPK